MAWNLYFQIQGLDSMQLGLDSMQLGLNSIAFNLIQFNQIQLNWNFNKNINSTKS
jgi:hypothetical protein